MERSATVRPALNFCVRLRRWAQIARIGGMAIRELSYVLRRDPGTGDDRLTPVTAVPDGVPGHLMERVIAATHRAEPAVGAALSYTRLPHRDGGGLLCSARPDEKSAGLRVDAQYAAGDDATWPHLPVDAWRPATLRRPDDEPFAEPGRRWDEALLVKHAREHAPRVAPFLADVRRLFADPAGRQIVVAEPDQETVARWIALACASLPEAHARSLTFMTATADPGGAPQQILGIGPGTDSQVFDRYDVLTVTHHYRVHDGLGGPGSPPLTDAWAELTAWLWRQGASPRPGDEPFVLLPLARHALAIGSWDELAALRSDVLREIAAAATDAAERDQPDADDEEFLTEICKWIGGHQPDAVQQLSLALARRRLKAAGRQDTDEVLKSCRDLPLDEAAWHTLRGEYGPPPEEELRKLLRYSFDTWEKPLRALLASGVGGGPVLDAAVAQLAEALSCPDKRRNCGEAVALLISLQDRGLVRRVLERLVQDPSERRIRGLRDLVRSVHGGWLRAHLDGAPLAVRLAVSAADLSREPYRLTGAEIWVELARRHLDGKVPDGATLRIMWALVWPPNGQPARPDQSRVTEVCSPRLIVEEGLELRLSHWLKRPDQVTPALIEFARETVASRKFNSQERAVARLLVLAHDFAHGRERLAPAMERLPALEYDAGRLPDALRDAVDRGIAHGIARTDPETVRDTRALDYVADNMKLIGHYQRAVADAHRSGGALDPASLREPRRVAILFTLWRERRDGARGAWKNAADQLTEDVIGPALAQLGEHGVNEVATLLSQRPGGQKWVQAWNKWSHQMKGHGGAREHG
ncbi:GTPase-associated protein 1-related protein [Streptomyces yerevanensis]|uniref:GTPase-associated protein 1-related protein n=1 Tax=Streptomyces yerevanensis TaxID=66378 RepID=UPI0012FEB5D0|nr:GTPase-associated protein 1-related protein [Streptomyces yerevanensis]